MQAALEGALTTSSSLLSYRPLMLMLRRHPKISALAATLFACSCPFTLPLLMFSSPLLLLALAFSRLSRWRWHTARLFLCNSASTLVTLFPQFESRSNSITLLRSDNVTDDPLPCSFFYKVEGFVDEFGEFFVDEFDEVIRDLVA